MRAFIEDVSIQRQYFCAMLTLIRDNGRLDSTCFRHDEDKDLLFLTTTIVLTKKRGLILIVTIHGSGRVELEKGGAVVVSVRMILRSYDDDVDLGEGYFRLILFGSYPGSTGNGTSKCLREDSLEKDDTVGRKSRARFSDDVIQEWKFGVAL